LGAAGRYFPTLFRARLFGTLPRRTVEGDTSLTWQVQPAAGTGAGSDSLRPRGWPLYGFPTTGKNHLMLTLFCSFTTVVILSAELSAYRKSTNHVGFAGIATTRIIRSI
jgi:hypothetical protein